MPDTTFWTIRAAARDTDSDSANDEPSHIHIPRPSRVRRLQEAGVGLTLAARHSQEEPSQQVQLALEEVA